MPGSFPAVYDGAEAFIDAHERCSTAWCAQERSGAQLSPFGLVVKYVVILSWGPAAGDVSFYEDVPPLPVTMVFVTLLCVDRLTTFAMARSKGLETWMDGKPVTVVEDGLCRLESLEGPNVSSSELFMELRQRGVENLGQVRLAILEIDGDVRLFFFEPEEVRAGLSVLTPEHRQVVAQPVSPGQRSAVAGVPTSSPCRHLVDALKRRPLGGADR